MQLLRTILIILLVYYIVKLFVRYIVPLLAKYFIRKVHKNYQKQYKKPERKEGEINIDYTPDKKKSLNDIGEYVDYEDLNE